MAERDTYMYKLMLDGTVVHYGITYDIARREAQHQREYQGSRIQQVGRPTTHEAALKWERREGARAARANAKRSGQAKPAVTFLSTVGSRLKSAADALRGRQGAA